MIQVICPSRGRPKAARELLESFLDTRTREDTHLVFALDEDDPTRTEYPGLAIAGVSTGDPTGPSNRIALVSDADVIGWMGDDSRFESKGWDSAVARALKDPGFAWGNDGHERPWPSTVFVSREIVRALGYLVLPGLHRGFFDVVWEWLANLTNSKHELDLMFRHINLSPEHPEGPTKEVIQRDADTFKKWQAEQMASDAQKVRTAIDLVHFFPQEATWPRP